MCRTHAKLIDSDEATYTVEQLQRWNRPPERARILLSMVDLRIKYRGGANLDVLSLLLSKINERGYPLFESFVSRSPKIESLYTNPEARATSILHGARSSLVHTQMCQLAREVLATLDALPRPGQSGLERTSFSTIDWSRAKRLADADRQKSRSTHRLRI